MTDKYDEPYFPQRGNDGYRAIHYDLNLDYRVASNRLEGVAVLTAAAEGPEPPAAFELDLSAALRVTRVTVDGGRARYLQRADKLRVTPDQPPAAGREFRVEVRYAGTPRPMESQFGGLGWEQLTDGALVASQPIGAPSWFPCDDRPDRKAGYRFEITAPSSYYVAANGVLEGKTRGGSTTTWVYRQSAPTATYLASVQIGRYTLIDLPAAANAEAPAALATPSVRQELVVPPRFAQRATACFAAQPRMMALFEDRFGPYPFEQYTVVVVDDELEIPIEAQGMSIFGVNHLKPGWEQERLIAHELAHQWFGNSLTVLDWRDIWLHEGFAAYAEWLWSEASGGRTADDHARRWHARLARRPQDLVLADPGRARMFDDRVYKRGALTLHALRLTVGDLEFFRLLREWVARHQYGCVRTEQFTALAGGELDTVVARGPGPFFERWLRTTKLPPLPFR